MLTEAEYAMERRKLGRSVHESDGVWWERTAFFYTKPAFEFRSFPPGKAKPLLSKSFLGYSHQVPFAAMSNRNMEFMLMDEETVRQFSMTRLRSEKRNQVRKGFKLCQVRRITDVEPHLEDMRQINISQAGRLMDDPTFCLPADHYTKHHEEWKADIRRHASFRGYEWWGAFHQDHLVAYMITLHVECVLSIQVMKTHSDHLKLCATDAVYFMALEKASHTDNCTLIVNGGSAREGLNKFKEQFLFRKTTIPCFTANAWLHAAARRLLQAKEHARANVLRMRSRLGNRATSS